MKQTMKHSHKGPYKTHACVGGAKETVKNLAKIMEITTEEVQSSVRW